jgi:rhamnosyltransferase
MNKVYAVIVTYNPDIDILRYQYHSIVKQVQGIIYVDNASTGIDILLTEFQSMAYFICNNENLGLGKAQNQGILLAKEKGATHVFLLDQDSVTSNGLVSNLLKVEREYENKGIKVGLVGPRILNALSSPPIYSDIFVFSDFRLKRIKIGNAPISVSYCIASGSLISIKVLMEVGLINDFLFIDALDVEWCLRAKSLGYTILMSPHAVLEHRLGNGCENKVLSHFPMREYYICRNSIILIKYGYIPIGYKLRKVILTPLRVLYSLLKGHFEHAKAGIRGIKDGVLYNVR